MNGRKRNMEGTREYKSGRRSTNSQYNLTCVGRSGKEGLVALNDDGHLVITTLSLAQCILGSGRGSCGAGIRPPTGQKWPVNLQPAVEMR